MFFHPIYIKEAFKDKDVGKMMHGWRDRLNRRFI